MYINSGYLNNSLLDFQDTDNPLTIGSCGTYFLQSYPKLQTCRPNGRVDYQLLYISAGTAHFYFDNETNEIIVPSGTMVLYRPGEFQKYEYYGTEQTEVYWLHFTGNDIPAILQDYGIMDDMRVFYAGVSLEYAALFKRIIIELQRCHPGYPEMLVLLFRQMLLLISRQLTRERIPGNGYMDMEMDLATQYFNDNYHTDICIEKYAASRGMSVSWFIRNFKQYTGSTPMQYLVSIRITNAQLLLETTSYTISEISHIVGYDNPLYFSRLFHKQKGIPPSAYRKNKGHRL